MGACCSRESSAAIWPVYADDASEELIGKVSCTVAVTRIDSPDLLFSISFKFTTSNISWSCERKLSDFRRLHRKIPTIEYSWFFWKLRFQKRKCWVDEDSQVLGDYITFLMDSEYRESPTFCNFCEFSKISVINGTKAIKEGYLMKKRGGRNFHKTSWLTQTGERFRWLLRGKYVKRWFALFENQLVVTSDHKSDQIQEVLILNLNLSIQQINQKKLRMKQLS
jgi:hypothetical protein